MGNPNDKKNPKVFSQNVQEGEKTDLHQSLLLKLPESVYHLHLLMFLHVSHAVLVVLMPFYSQILNLKSFKVSFSFYCHNRAKR